MTDEHMKRCPTTLAIRETDFKSTVRYHFIHDRMDVRKKKTFCKGVEKWESSSAAAGNVKCCNLFG